MAWSRLARFDFAQLAFLAANENDFESDSGHRVVHKEFGRLICWIAFSVGGEYICKGACLLKGRDVTVSVDVIRAPAWNEDLNIWSALVNSKDPQVNVKDLGLGTLGRAPINSILTPSPEREIVCAAIRFLASTIRNRDAHRYAPDVRAGHFQAVPRLFVPAFNALLRCLNQPELRSRLVGVEGA